MKRILPLFLLLLSAPLAHAAPSVSLVPSRTTGVAPLSVFFDATLTTDPAVTSKPFHELEYTWNFGDDDTVTWSTGAHVGDGSIYSKKNRASGPVSAHVYETPGTYTVTLTVNDGITTSTQTQTITVQDPNVVFSGTNTICIAATTDPVPGGDGCPTGADHHQLSDWPTIVGTYLGTNKRILLKGSGDVYTGGPNPSLGVIGPAMIGMYGGGSKPIIRVTANGPYSQVLLLSGILSDVRVVDLDVDGQNQTQLEMAHSANGSTSNLLFLRLDIHDIGSGIVLDFQNTIPNNVAFVDSTIRRTMGGGSNSSGPMLYIGGYNVVNMGNLFDDSTAGSAEHLVRHPYILTGVVSDNTLQKGKIGKEMMSIRSYSPNAVIAGVTGDTIVTKHVEISDNLIKTNTYAGIQLAYSGGGDLGERWRDIIIERNYFPQTTGAGVAIRALGDKVTIRNNIIDMTNGGDSGIGADGASSSIPPASNFNIYNNTIYNSSGPWSIGIVLSTGGTGHIVKNNLGYVPASVQGPVFISDSSTGAVKLSNSAEGNGAGGIKISPSFTSFSPVIPSDFSLLSSSYAISSGTSVPVFSDFFGTKRSTSIFDMGAVAYNTLSSTPTPQPLTGDLNSDHIVNALDWSLMNAKWFTNDTTADLNRDGVVNAIDFSLLNANWFKTW